MSGQPWLFRQVRWPRLSQPDLWAGLGILLLPLFFFRHAVLGHGVLFRRDISLVWYPQVESFVRCISLGSWPLWDPYRGFGQPLLADPSAEVLYPFTWMNLIAPPWVVYACFVVVHLSFSGIGLYALARRLGVSRLGAFTAALAWCASGPFLSLASTWHHMAGAAWIPWVFLASEVALDTGKSRCILLWSGTIAAQILAGSADMVAMTLIAWALFAAVHRIEWTRPIGTSNRRLAATTFIGVGVGLALSAGQWLPTLEMARGTARFGLDAQERTTWSVHPLVMLETILPFQWNQLPLSPHSIQELLEWREPWLHSIYLGIPLLALAIAGASSAGRRGALVLLAGGAALVALGRHTPVYALVVWLLPPLRALRFPVKAMVIVAFALSLLAGMGFDEWRRDPRLRCRRWQLRVVVPLGLLTLAAVTAWILGTSAASSWAPSLLTGSPTSSAIAVVPAAMARRVLAAALVAGATVFLGSSHGLSGPVQALGVGLAMLFDLGTAHRDLHPVAPKAIFTYRPEVLSALDSAESRRVFVNDYPVVPRGRPSHGDEPSPFRLESVPGGWAPLQTLTLAALAYLTPPTGGRWGVSGSYDLDLLGLQPRPLTELNELVRRQQGTPAQTRLLQLGSVSNVIDLAPPSGWPDLSLVAVVPGLFSEPIRVYRVPQPLPRAYVVGKALTVDGQAALEALVAPEFDARDEVILSEGSGGSMSAGPLGRARIEDSRPDRVLISAELSSPGYLVLVDAYDPGWQVLVDGRSARLLRANVAFRAVEVPVGSHTVEFRYRPRAVVVGLMVSGTTLLAALAFWLPARRAES